MAAKTPFPSTKMMSPADLERATWLLGPFLIGAFLDVFLQGILCCQFVRYAIRYYRRDRLWIKVAVLILAIITTLKMVHSFAICWILFIDYFTDLDGAIALGYTAWWLSYSVLLVASVDLYVQAFFVSRLYYISGRKWWIAAPIGVILVAAYAAICVASHYVSVGVSATPLMGPWFATHFGLTVAGDVLMTSGMTYFLMKKRKGVLPQTVGLFTALIQLTWLSVAPAMICAVVNLITNQLWHGTERLLSATFSMMLPKLYAISMMWSLNARLDIRAAGTKNLTGQLIINESRNIALHPTSSIHQGVQVQVSRETTHQVDSGLKDHDELHDHGLDGTLTGKSVYLVDSESV